MFEESRRRLIAANEKKNFCITTIEMLFKYMLPFFAGLLGEYICPYSSLRILCELINSTIIAIFTLYD